jgi:hypothetical protein
LAAAKPMTFPVMVKLWAPPDEMADVFWTSMARLLAPVVQVRVAVW